ncbi:MAG: GspE/PulE family protein [Planctomycetota bacterium]|jgi:type IV pilus assembly protein PilB
MKLPFVSQKKRRSAEPQKASKKHVDGDATGTQVGSDGESICGLTDLYIPEEVGDTCVRDIVDVLLDMGKLSPEQHAQVRKKHVAKPGHDVSASLLKAKLCSADDVLMAKAELCGLEFRHLAPKDVQRQAFEKLDLDFIKSGAVCPVAVEEEVLVVATSEPSNVLAVEDVKRRSQMDVRVFVCSQQDIETVCEALKEEKVEDNLDDIISDMTEVEIVQDHQDEQEDLEQMAGQSPVIKFVNYLISNAIREGASDIHIEPKDKITRIRHRIDGVLFEMKQSPAKMHPAIVSRIKIMSNLDISERRLPQDGKISIIIGGREIDLRVSTLPTNHGEKVVIRILDSQSIIRGLEQLGMERDVMAAFGSQVVLPHGILLVTGPTGSGKSTTLYSSLCQMDGDKLNISTVEDPVEYQLGFCNQVQVNDKVGLTFASALRSLLRQDPDVIMIGEIRDNETARIAVQAALTGHLVLSTLHTNDAASSVTRLVNIGIEPYLIAASLNAVLAQRLVRKICPKCKKNYKIPENMRKYAENAGVKAKQLFHGTGCDQCRGSGYAGRAGIYELLIIDELFRDMINKDASVNSMRRALQKTGAATLFDDGIKKVKKGLTTIEEVLRVTEVYGKSEDEVFVENVGQ